MRTRAYAKPGGLLRLLFVRRPPLSDRSARVINADLADEFDETYRRFGRARASAGLDGLLAAFAALRAKRRSSCWPKNGWTSPMFLID